MNRFHRLMPLVALALASGIAASAWAGDIVDDWSTAQAPPVPKLVSARFPESQLRSESALHGHAAGGSEASP
jgi:hypothetical protein